MEKIRTNVIYALAKYPHLDNEEKELVERLSYLNPKIADYLGHENIQTDQILRAHFKLGSKIKSKEELEEKLISECILTKDNSITVQETIKQTEYGKMYFLSSKASKFAVYFINPEQ